MAKSFFERLTGSVRVEDDSDRTFVEPKAVPSRPLRARSRKQDLPDEGRILHPTASDSGQAEHEVSIPEAAEEGQLTVDIYDDGANIVIQSTVAGVKPEDIDIALQDDALTIRGSRKRAQEVNEESFYYKELYWGSFSRSIILPEEVDFQRADASLKNGVLTVRLPKKDRGEKKIRVKME